MAPSLEFWLYLPQMRLSLDQMVERARTAEAAGFDGIAGMDHMAPPLAEDQPMFEAMISTTWLAAHTSRLSLGSLVLCDSFRHPAQLAREAVSLDHASGGRFELGIGWGSVAREFDTFGVGSTEPRFRVSRLKESLDIITALWRGEAFDYDRGALHAAFGPTAADPDQHASPSSSVGPARRRWSWSPRTRTGGTCTLGSWTATTNCGHRPAGPDLRCSCRPHSCASEDRREEIVTTAQRRFGKSIVAGSPTELVDYFGSLGRTRGRTRLRLVHRLRAGRDGGGLRRVGRSAAVGTWDESLGLGTLRSRQPLGVNSRWSSVQPSQDVGRDVLVVPVLGRTVGRLGDPDVAHASEEPLDADTGLRPGQRSSGAGVRPPSEGEVLLGVRAGPSGRRRARRSGGVAPGGPVEHHHGRAGAGCRLHPPSTRSGQAGSRP